MKYIASYRLSCRVSDRLRNHVCIARREYIHDSYVLQVGDEVILSQLAGSDTPGSVHSVRPKVVCDAICYIDCANLGSLVKSS